jgi:hypothetical protein
VGSSPGLGGREDVKINVKGSKDKRGVDIKGLLRAVQSRDP